MKCDSILIHNNTNLSAASSIFFVVLAKFVTESEDNLQRVKQEPIPVASLLGVVHLLTTASP